MNKIPITAIILTKGGYPLDDIVDSLQYFDQVIIADNSKLREGLKVYLRYVAAFSETARHNIVYVQDDDALVDVRAVVDQWREYMAPMVCNMPPDRRAEYKRWPGHISLVGWGTIFNRHVVKANLDRFLKRWPIDELFLRECDRVATYLTPHVDVQVNFKHLERAHGLDRMGREARHGNDLQEICIRLEKLRS